MPSCLQQMGPQKNCDCSPHWNSTDWRSQRDNRGILTPPTRRAGGKEASTAIPYGSAYLRRTACGSTKSVLCACHVWSASHIPPVPSPVLQACHWAIDELKASVPIWKKEFFAGSLPRS